MIIGKLVFGKDGLQFGLELCLARAGITAYPVTEATVTGCDVVLVSLCWYRDVYRLEAFQRRTGVHRGTGRPYWLAGGMQATMTPEVVAELVDAVFVGDGEEDLAGLLQQIEEHGDCDHPCLFKSGQDKVPEPKVCTPTAHAIQTNEGHGTWRVEIARGCKWRCAFCALGHLKPYAEVPLGELELVMRRIRNKRASFFAPERTAHSEWAAIKAGLRRHRIQDLSMDARLENLQEVDGPSVALGLEGLSERLRRTVGKPFTDDFILERIGGFVDSRRRVARVTTYFIGDLPGEEDSDWEAAWVLMHRINEAPWSRRLAITPCLFPLTPKRVTRLRDATIHLFRPYEKRWMDLITNHGKQWGFRVIHTLVNGPMERIMDALVERGGAPSYRVVRCLPDIVLCGKPPVSERLMMARKILANCKAQGISLEQLETGRRPGAAV